MSMKVLIFQQRPSCQNYVTFTFSNLDNFMQNMTNQSQIISRRNVFQYHFYLRGVFHLHLFAFPFVCGFNSRIHSSSANKYLVQNNFNKISASFRNLFVVVLHEKECSFYSHIFCCTEMRWLFISSTAVWVTGSIASRAKTQLTSSKCD